MIVAVTLLLSVLALANPVTEQLVARVGRAKLPGDLAGRVQTAVASGKLAEAEQALVDESNRSPNPDVLSLAAAIFLADNQPANAAIALKKAEKLRPLAPEEHFTLAMAYVAMKRSTWARAELTDLARQTPSDSRFCYWLARLNYDDGKYEDAEHMLRKVIELEPSSARAYDNLGLNLEALGRLEEALSAYARGITLTQLSTEPTPWPALNYGTLALRMGRMSEARAALEQAIHIEPNSAQAHYRLGVWFERQGEAAKAIPELQTAAHIDPKYSDPWWALARLLRRAGDIKSADAALATFKQLKNHD